jgi:hypothetical protein
VFVPRIQGEEVGLAWAAERQTLHVEGADVEGSASREPPGRVRSAVYCFPKQSVCFEYHVEGESRGPCAGLAKHV